MHPEAQDIAVPPFPADTAWVGGKPLAVERLCARGPVLVHFICAGDPGSVRTLPYLRAWRERYREAGLSVLAVNTPRFPFTAELPKLEAALARLRLGFPVALDSRHAIWRDYGCRGWPSLFLWGRGGVLRWYHFGEGEYAATEEEVQSLLWESDALAEVPAVLEPLRPGDAPGALVMRPSAEVLPGGSPSDPWTAGRDGDSLTVEYEAGGAAVSVDGEGELRVSLDGGAERALEVTAPGVYELTAHDRHEQHALTLRPSAGIAVYAISFAPGRA